MELTDRELKLIKLRELEIELFLVTITKLVDSNNIYEMNKFVDYMQNKEIYLSINQFIHKRIYELKDKVSESKDILVDYNDIDQKINIFKKLNKELRN